MSDPLQALFDEIETNKAYSFDVEHDPNVGLYDKGFTLHGMTIHSGKVGFYLKSKESVLRVTEKLFPRGDLVAAAHNAKYDMKAGILSGWTKRYPEVVFDTMIAENVLHDNLKPDELGLKPTILRRFGKRMVDFETASAYGLNSAEFEAYALDDGLQEYRLYEAQKAELEAQGLYKYVIGVPALHAFADVELHGHPWDFDRALELIREFRKVRDRLEDEVYAEIGRLNLNSPKQLATRLFEDMKISSEGLAKTPTGAVSLNEENLEKLARTCPAAQKIVRYRTGCKMLSTYLCPLTDMALKDPNSRIHANFWLVSSTGRTRCSDPNLQNIPTMLDKVFGGRSIREPLAAPPGKKLIVCDLSQIELRQIAHFTSDPSFLKAYLDWQCTSCGKSGSSPTILHACPECGCPEDEGILKDPTIKGFWHGLDLHTNTAEKVKPLRGDRKAGKVSNFALVYNATAWRMHYAYPEYSPEEWQEIIEAYFDTYPGVRRWHQALEAQMYKTGVVSDIFKRKRRLSPQEIRHAPKHALNQFINFGPQASACGMMQLSMTYIRNRFIREGVWGDRIKCINMVHDELVYEADAELAVSAKDTIVKVLENAVRLKVPVRSSWAIVDRWSEAK
jgi:DNA polymerase-1